MKEILEIHGFAEGATDSPKMILKTAYKAGMIKDEELWLSALQERNNVTHSYNRKIAMGIITQAKQKFYKMFCEILYLIFDYPYKHYTFKYFEV